MAFYYFYILMIKIKYGPMTQDDGRQWGNNFSWLIWFSSQSWVNEILVLLWARFPCPPGPSLQIWSMTLVEGVQDGTTWPSWDLWGVSAVPWGLWYWFCPVGFRLPFSRFKSFLSLSGKERRAVRNTPQTVFNNPALQTMSPAVLTQGRCHE